jgi:hypothetical protein
VKPEWKINLPAAKLALDLGNRYDAYVISPTLVNKGFFLIVIEKILNAGLEVYEVNKDLTLLQCPDHMANKK